MLKWIPLSLKSSMKASISILPGLKIETTKPCFSNNSQNSIMFKIEKQLEMLCNEESWQMTNWDRTPDCQTLFECCFSTEPAGTIPCFANNSLMCPYLKNFS
ncbi:hypothetical protein C0J52_23012 [Blattella germanica]|nr:hypothetical protein C0J52_23012 [Blattella germanica]